MKLLKEKSILFLLCSTIMAGYYQYDYSKNGEDNYINKNILEKIENERWERARAKADISMRETETCLMMDNADPYLDCQVDWSFRNRVLFYKRIMDEASPEIYGDNALKTTNRQKRNVWLIILAISVILRIISVRSRQENES